MFNRIMVAALVLLAGANAALTIVLLVAIGNLAPNIAAAIEAVAIIEEAARSSEEDMQILGAIADQEQCHANRGEWSAEHGCFLQEVGQ